MHLEKKRHPFFKCGTQNKINKFSKINELGLLGMTESAVLAHCKISDDGIV